MLAAATCAIRRAHRWIGCAAVCAGMFVFGGCSSGRLPTYPVSGKVVFPDGSPAHVGTVEFRSREHGIQARGEIGIDGRFQLTTYKDGDGAVAGTHDCVVVQLVIVEGIANFRPSTEGVVHPRFGSYSTSGLSCEVSAADANNLTITVEGLDAPLGKGDSDHDHSHQHEHAGGQELEPSAD